MNKKARVKLQRDIKKFITTLKYDMRVMAKYYNESNNNRAFPYIFYEKSMSIDCYYSSDREHLFIAMYKSDEDSLNIEFVKGNVTDSLDESRLWKNMPTAFKIINSKANIRNTQIQGMKPFDIYGDNIYVQFEDLKFSLPEYKSVSIDYGIIISKRNFENILNDVDGFIVKSSIGFDYYHKIYKSKLFNDSSRNKLDYLNSLYNLKSKMEYYFFDEGVLELDIDKFIYENPLILEVAFGFKELKSQVTLKDFSGRCIQDLKPDLIAFNLHEKIWTVVDYKRSKSALLKNIGLVRESFKSDVNDLKAQLRDYVEYFEDGRNRDYFHNEYGVMIDFPKAVGIIGKLDDELSINLNRMLKDEPRWFNLRPYNYIYDSFLEYIELQESYA